MVAAVACSRPAPADRLAPSPDLPVFADVTAAAGLRFQHVHGGTGKRYLPEAMGPGGAFLDYDGDGWLDVLLPNGRGFDVGAPAGTTMLYRNRGDGTFADVTARVGLHVPAHVLGVAAADYDNDGDTDVYLTAVGRNHLFRNVDGARFEDVTAASGTGDRGFSTSAAWLDYDRDGLLDLFVANYVEWTPATDRFCTLDGAAKSYCTPETYPGQSSRLYRNRGGGRFDDVTRRAGVYNASDKALGVAVLDYDDDGWVDVFVANDTQPNRLYRNTGAGTFTDEALLAGVALSDAGKARGGMGTDAADFDGSGRPGILVGNFSGESLALYRNHGGGLFVDAAASTGLRARSLRSLTFAAFFFDYDLDGRLDVFALNGHVADDIAVVQPQTAYAQPPHLFRNLGGSRFEEVTARSGDALARPVVGRGAACGDYDNDGDLDLLLLANDGPARLLRNDGATPRDVVRVRLQGVAANRDGLGARVTVRRAGGTATWQMVRTGSSYLSQSDIALTFGLGPADGTPLDIDVRWPDGTNGHVAAVPPNQAVVIRQGAGVVAATPLAAPRPR
ncbi:MAG: CRTAC1 family protein [Vicinamibacterales bacterium]